MVDHRCSVKHDAHYTTLWELSDANHKSYLECLIMIKCGIDSRAYCINWQCVF